jgi:hypothetical protein
MKNNNMLNNNTNVSFMSRNKNLVVLGIIVVFLIIVGVVLYRNNGDFSFGDSEVTEDILPVSNFSLPPVSESCNSLNSRNNNVQNDPGNVNLLDNLRDKSVEEELNKKQVYNISNNIFSFKDARAACKAHGGDLATYHQVLDTYNKGGEWCNYGWSDGQMALYPTQKDTWEELESDPDSAGTCGNWGVNGGYFDNPNTLFGANCYGIKPKPKNREQEKVLAFTKNQKVMLDKINMYKSQMNEMTVLPFNKNIWSEKGKLN